MLSPRLEPWARTTPLSQAREGYWLWLQGDLGFDGFQDKVKVFEDVFVAEPEDAQALRLEVLGSDGIMGDGFSGVMDGSVHFNDQLGACAVKINNVAPKHFLPQKAHALELPSSQRLPQDFFCIRGLFAKRPLQLEQVPWLVSKSPHIPNLQNPTSPNPHHPNHPHTLLSLAREGWFEPPVRAGERA
jgi:hypothetical protein